MNDVLAYHIVWTTYGTWLPGDRRGWVTKKVWGIHPPEPAKETAARDQLAEAAVWLTGDQRAVVEKTIADHCRIRSWTLHAVHVLANHVHVIVTADRPWQDVRDQFKAWCARKLSDAAGLTEQVAEGAGRKRWFSEGGNCEYIDSEEYLANAIRYVENQ
ncbi:MAG TPA: hypothetical protein VH120_10695 [Gemmataceae bacterium]|jgi:REP element-mobilizing transposase RayT|nr:hypothetical protein [Gemmataceae bacterium]